MRHDIKARLHKLLDEDFAWDILTADSMVAIVLALVLAVGSSVSDAFAQRLAESKRWEWIAASAVALVALACMLRIAWANVQQRAAMRRVQAPPTSGPDSVSAHLLSATRRCWKAPMDVVTLAKAKRQGGTRDDVSTGVLPVETPTTPGAPPMTREHGMLGDWRRGWRSRLRVPRSAKASEPRPARPNSGRRHQRQAASRVNRFHRRLMAVDGDRQEMRGDLS